MPGPEGGVVSLACKKRRQGACYFRGVALRPCLVQQVAKGNGLGLVHRGTVGCPARNHELAVLKLDCLLFSQVQGGYEAFDQFRQKVQRAAQKGHVAADGLSAGKAAYGLLHNGLQD